MKLELEHLVGYLPYGLLLWYPEKLPFSEFLDTKKEAHSLKMGVVSMMSCIKGNCKPILHPLSEYCGKVIAKDAMSKLNCDLQTVYEIWALEDGSMSLDKISYKTYIVLCKNRVDFNNLIGEGLAIDINTL